MSRSPIRHGLLALLLASGSSLAASVEDRGLSKAPATPSSSAGGLPNAGNPAWNLFRQMEELQNLVARLQGQVEEQQQALDKMKQSLSSRYNDLDERFEQLGQRLEETRALALAKPAAAPVQPVTPPAAPVTAVPAAPVSVPPANIVLPTSSPASQAQAPTQSVVTQQTNEAGNIVIGERPVTPPPAEPARPESETDALEAQKKSYLAAYQRFRTEGPSSAIKAMQGFVKQYPASVFAPNAYYWLGEFNLAVEPADYVAAETHFKRVIRDYEGNVKVPAAFYKLATIADLRRQRDEAKRLMKEVITRFPNTSEARLAQIYLDQNAAGVAKRPGKP